MSALDVQGNGHADKLAGTTAERVSVPLNVSAPVIYYHCLTKRIQRRLATIIMHLPARAKHRNTKVKRQHHIRDNIDDLIALSQHVAYQHENRVACARCRDSFQLQDQS